ncbi:tetratricopeptide repeat protein [bacterium]|nr:tetratricopeptide repeat protein [bacterium]
MGAGYFFGIWLVFVFVIISVEYYFLVLDKYLEDEMSKISFLVLSLISILAFLLHCHSIKSMYVNFYIIFFIPIACLIVSFLENSFNKVAEEAEIERNIEHLKETINRQPNISAPYVALGDVYFKIDKNDKALYYYKKAYQIEDTPEIRQKIKITTKELKISKGELWVCRYCGRDNPLNIDRCKECEESRNTGLSFKEDLLKNREDIKNWIIKGFLIPLVLLLVFILMRSILSSFQYTIFAIFAVLLLVYFILKKFFTW